MASDKIKTVQEWPEPKKIKNVQAFLEFTNFYSYFIYNYLDVAALLIQLIQKDIL